MNPLVILAALGAAAYALSKSEKTASAGPSPSGLPGTQPTAGVPGPSYTATTSPGLPTASIKPPAAQPSAAHGPNDILPAELAGQMVAVLAGGNVAAMRALALQLRALGWPLQAGDLEAAANTKEHADALLATVVKPPSVQSSGTPAAAPPVSATSGQLPSVSIPIPGVGTVTTPAINIPAPIQTVLNGGGDPKGVLAAQVQTMLTLARTPGKEDQKLVKAYQKSEGFTQDGLYGQKAAKAAIKYGFVPVYPFYWSKTAATKKADQAAWKKLMLDYAKKDPSRAAEWTSASKPLTA